MPMLHPMDVAAVDRDLAWADALCQAVATRTGGAGAGAVPRLTEGVGRALGLRASEALTLALTARLHDIGKLALPDAILTKPGFLLDADIVLVRSHPALGAAMLDALDGLSATRAAIRATHERHDGAGYPAGLRGEDIPVAARVVAVADAFSAMTSPRPWRDPLTDVEALDEITMGAGRLYDPRVVEHFVAAVLPVA